MIIVTNIQKNVHTFITSCSWYKIKFYKFRDSKLTGDGNFKIDILVEGILIAKGEGKTPIVAQEDAMEDFVER